MAFSGYATPDARRADYFQRLKSLVHEIPELFNQLSDVDLLYKSSEASWSRKEILGHLIDSAINNLKRFVDAQYHEQPYPVPSYNQDELVKINDYQHQDLHHLLALWKHLNLQILTVINRMPANKLKVQVIPTYQAGGPGTLEWLFCDYVAHLEHHRNSL